MSDERSRRELFGSLFDALRGATRPAASNRKPTPETALRPPGALTPDERFVAACTGCEECAKACPPDAIVMISTGDESRLPAIAPAAQACLLCSDLPCIQACDDGALEAVATPSLVRLGIARVDPRRCVTFHGQPCQKCFAACPYPHTAIMMIGGRPLIGSGACTGCGLCERACPEEPKAIRVIPERDLVPGLRIPRSEMQGG